jgi:hypothetical protein
MLAFQQGSTVQRFAVRDSDFSKAMSEFSPQGLSRVATDGDMLTSNCCCCGSLTGQWLQ